MSAIPWRRGRVSCTAAPFSATGAMNAPGGSWRSWGETDAVVNHGFGGATADELLYYYPRNGRPYAPKCWFWRGGPNFYSPDSARKRPLSSPSGFEWAKKDFPEIKIVILAIFDYRSQREEVQPAFAEYNRLCRRLAQLDSQTEYLDINDFFL